MARKTAEKRADLRNRLIEIADTWIAREGMENIKARPLAAEAGCAVGAIYNVFEDLDDLVMEVNSRTFKQLASDVGEKGQDPNLDPAEALIRLALAYKQFATDNHFKWQTLFDLRVERRNDPPDWYMTELRQLFMYIAAPVSRQFPDLPPEDVELMTRALFSSVHGMVTLGLENRFSGVSPDKLEKMIRMILTRIS